MSGRTSTGIDAALASMLCYAGWWLTGVVFLIVERQHQGVRFHAAQSLVVFGVLSAAMVALGGVSVVALLLPGPAFRLLQAIGNLVWLGAVLLWIALLVKTFRGETWRVPLASGVADRIAG
ncbi:MAG: DUF4870 domain-containing protein [Vicinamibacterales bacterium]